MALTRKFLEALGLNESQVQAIVDEHTAVTTAIRTDWETRYNAAKAAADKAEGIQKELDDLKKEDYKSRYETEKAAHETLLNEVNGAKAKAAKETALKAYFDGKKITGTNQKIALRGINFDKINVDENGAITDTKALDDLVAGDYATLVDAGKRVVDTGAHLGDNGGSGNTNYDLRAAIKDALK